MTKISVIIPTLGEGDTLPRLLTSLFDQGFDEVIVADASTQNTTYEVAVQAGATCLTNLRRGRGSQMQAGAKMATGDILFFLHADSVLPPHARQAIEIGIKNARSVAGSFSLAFDHRHPILALYACFSRLNWKIATYGDQGLFVKRTTYETIGGFQALALLEDIEIQTRLRRVGGFVKLPSKITTSARRFLQRGILRQQMLNVIIVLAYLAGLSPDRLARWYDLKPIETD